MAERRVIGWRPILRAALVTWLLPGLIGLVLVLLLGMASWALPESVTENSRVPLALAMASALLIGVTLYAWLGLLMALAPGAWLLRKGYGFLPLVGLGLLCGTIAGGIWALADLLDLLGALARPQAMPVLGGLAGLLLTPLSWVLLRRFAPEAFGRQA